MLVRLKKDARKTVSYRGSSDHPDNRTERTHTIRGLDHVKWVQIETSMLMVGRAAGETSTV